MSNRDRNQLCPCNSGLKLKNCHGDGKLQQAATTIAKHMITLFTTQRMHEKGLIDVEATEDAIKKLVESANKYLPECVEFKTNYTVEDEPEPSVDKLAEKLGVAVEKLQPLAEETIRQYVARETAYAIIGGFFAFVGFFFLFCACPYFVKKVTETKEEAYGSLAVGCGIFGVVGIIGGLVEGISALGNVLAPIPGLLGL